MSDTVLSTVFAIENGQVCALKVISPEGGKKLQFQQTRVSTNAVDAHRKNA